MFLANIPMLLSQAFLEDESLIRASHILFCILYVEAVVFDNWPSKL